MSRSHATLLLLLLLGALPSLAQDSIDRFAGELVEAALERTSHQVTYDGSYRRLDYPGGDVPDHIGVCTDVVIRSYRVVGIDLQQLVHEDTSCP